MSTTIGTPGSRGATRLMLLGSGEQPVASDVCVAPRAAEQEPRWREC